MMEEALQRYLENPSSLEQADVYELENIARQFPFFSIAQMLLAKKYKQQNHPDATVQLNKAALTVNDRSLLFAFMNEEISSEPHSKPMAEAKNFAEKEAALSEVLSSNEELRAMLKTIHENKQALLDSTEVSSKSAEDERESSEFEEEEKMISEVSSSQIEYSLLEVEEEGVESQSKDSNEQDSISSIESELADQLEYEQQEDLLVLNEVSGGGAEYMPTEFTRQEDHEEEFIVEQDAELQSNNLIEEEFIARETEFESHEKELEHLSKVESSENSETVESEYREPDFSSMEIQSETIIEEELIDHETEHSFGAIPEIESEQVVLEEPVPEKEDSFRINETVGSPGEFLPEKSYSFSKWLQFFRLSQPPPKIKKEEPRTVQEKPEFDDENHLTGNMMKQELESIDKIVSVIHPTAELEESNVSAEELAKKSSEWDEEIVSETLAKIFEAQGHYTKAIRMYVKLSLRFPDKVSFFAARIKELKSKK